MTPAPDTFSPDVDVEEAAAWLIETGYRHLPVMRDGELLGIASIRDLLWAMVEGIGLEPTADRRPPPPSRLPDSRSLR